MRKVIVLGSLCVVMLLFLASLSSVIAYQSVQTQNNQMIQSFKNKMQTAVESLLQSMKKKLVVREDVPAILLNNNNIGDVRVRSLLNRCDSFHDALANNATPQRMLVVLVLTILTEFAVYLLAVNAPATVLLMLSVIINSITNPAVNFIYYNVYNNVFVLETLVVIVESFMIYMLFNAASVKVSFVSAAFLSLFANLASYIFATGLTRFIFDALLVTN